MAHPRASFRVDLEKKTCLPRKEEGFGIRSLEAVNIAFLKKIAWRVMTEKALACDYLRGKYVKDFIMSNLDLLCLLFGLQFTPNTNIFLKNAFGSLESLQKLTFGRIFMCRIM